jgi:hypothetical protein
MVDFLLKAHRKLSGKKKKRIVDWYLIVCWLFFLCVDILTPKYRQVVVSEIHVKKIKI